jgi:hypothetical protein
MRLVILALVALLTSPPLQAQGARIVEWVEEAPASDSSKIALGYPVPIPVDTALPFDGFRTYNGLHMRHQDLVMTTPWVHAHELGATRQGRTIWLYQLGDSDRETSRGLPEHAMLTNAGIHAREWQSPEVATGIMELIALNEDDNHLISYLRDNANILIIPSLNIDGFLQTQRFPRRNWLQTDPDDPGFSPRDGRMRRKNMLGADEDLNTVEDHLLGVDLNRNNPPYWATNPGRSSGNEESIVHHGAAPHSEPETQALASAVHFGPLGKLSMYTDMHSFSQVHFWGRNSNDRLAKLTEKLLRTFTTHHYTFPANKYYSFSSWVNVPRNQGIGLTDGYFTHTHQVPSWTLEIEPSNGSHPGLPGQGADYGGYSRNGHDGFILPDSEVERVRTEVAQSMAVAYYQQAGPPSITAISFTDTATGATVFEAEWDTADPTSRTLHTFQSQPLQLERDYLAWVAWDRPMRWRTDGVVTPLPGKPLFSLDVNQAISVAENSLDTTFGAPLWLDQPGNSSSGYLRYRDDAVNFDMRFLSSENNLDVVQGPTTAVLEMDTYDMVGIRGDADPSTVARWEEGAWAGYEESTGIVGRDIGGVDATVPFQVTSESLGDPFVVVAGTSSAWFDTSRNGEGFLLEILAGARAVVYWFTYDEEGRQDWYIAEGEIRGNRILFPELMRVSGGEFGPGFNPDNIVNNNVGSASFIWSSCDSGAMSWVINKDGGSRRQGRMNLTRLSRVMGIDCGKIASPPVLEAMRLSGSWYDPSHSGEGYVLEVLADQRVLAYWFSFDMEGNRRWFFGTGEISGSKLIFEEMHTTIGGVFGPGFDPLAVEVKSWGSLELELDCASGTARFTPEEEGFPAGSLNLTRLTFLDGLKCDS